MPVGHLPPVRLTEGYKAALVCSVEIDDQRELFTGRIVVSRCIDIPFAGVAVYYIGFVCQMRICLRCRGEGK